MRSLMKYLHPFFGYIAVTLSIKFIASIVELFIPLILATIIDDIVPTGDVRAIFLWGGMMALCAVTALVGNVVANRMAAKSSGSITEHIRHDLFYKISFLSARQLDRFTIPSAVSRLTTDTYNVNQMLARMQRLGVRGPILLVGGIIITMIMDAGLTMVLLLTLPVIAVLVYAVTKKGIPLYTKQQGVLDRMVRVVQENITGARVIKALSKSSYERARYDRVNNDLADVEQHAGNVMAITNPGSTLILNLGLTLVVAVGAFRLNAGLTSSGVIIAFLNYFTIILNAMLGITRIFVLCSKGEASAKRIAEVLRTPQDLTVEPADEKESEVPDEPPAHIVFDHVCFSYEKVKANVKDLSFSLNRGQTLGIIGATGSGKSTIINLLMRFYDVDSGCILIDGKDIRTIESTALQKKFGVVFQNDFLFADTIEENIRYFRALSREEIADAAQAAQAQEFIDTVGMDYGVLARGNNLSGGQKQRLLIARALAAKPEILILDDASSALDYKTDAVLRRELSRRHFGTTSIIVAQRISSIKGADMILVLENGSVIGCGTHNTLMKTCAVYQEIAESQMGEGAHTDA